MSAAAKKQAKTELQETAAGQKVGRVFLDAVMANFPKHSEARQLLAEFAQSKDALIAAETDEAKRLQMLEEGRKAYADREREVMIPIFQAVSEAVETVAKTKNLSAVYNVGAILFGGTDITDDVIKELNKQQ